MASDAIAVIHLPRPPSVNNLFVTVEGLGNRRVRGKPYNDWFKAASDMQWGKKLKPIEGPVHIKIIVEDRGTGDLDNFAKACIDFAVRLRIIEDDNRPIVRKITMEWADIGGARMEITALNDCKTAANVG